MLAFAAQQRIRDCGDYQSHHGLAWPGKPARSCSWLTRIRRRALASRRLLTPAKLKKKLATSTPRYALSPPNGPGGQTPRTRPTMPATRKRTPNPRQRTPDKNGCFNRSTGSGMLVLVTEPMSQSRELTSRRELGCGEIPATRQAIADGLLNARSSADSGVPVLAALRVPGSMLLPVPRGPPARRDSWAAAGDFPRRADKGTGSNSSWR